MIKKILVGFVVLVCVLGGGFYVAIFQNGQRLVKVEVEQTLARITGMRVEIESVELVPAEHRVRIRGLTIANPAGFSARHAFAFSDVAIHLRPSGPERPLLISELVIDHPTVAFEHKGGRSNLQIIADNVAEAARKPALERRVVVDRVTSRDGELSIAHDLLPGKSFPGQFPDLSLLSVGVREGGLAPEVVVQRLMANLVKEATRAALLEMQRVSQSAPRR